MVFHTKDNIEEIFNYVPREIFPEEYGGTAGTIKELTGKIC